MVTAACLVTRTEVFNAIGGFDDHLAVAFNEVDYYLRLREKGLLVIWTPCVEFYHLESVSRGDDIAPNRVRRLQREQQYLIARWADVLAGDPYHNPNLSLEGRTFALADRARIRRPWVEA